MSTYTFTPASDRVKDYDKERYARTMVVELEGKISGGFLIQYNPKGLVYIFQDRHGFEGLSLCAGQRVTNSLNLFFNDDGTPHKYNSNYAFTTKQWQAITALLSDIARTFAQNNQAAKHAALAEQAEYKARKQERYIAEVKELLSALENNTPLTETPNNYAQIARYVWRKQGSDKY